MEVIVNLISSMKMLKTYVQIFNDKVNHKLKTPIGLKKYLTR
jgi:hypothetical protein